MDAAGVVKLGEIHGNTARDEEQTAKYNGGMFIWGATEVEKEMNEVIALAISPPSPNGWITPAGGFFRRHFLEASHLQFAAKLKIIEDLIDERCPMSNTQIKEFSGKIRRVMRYRNAFAHGHLTFDANHGCTLSYYEGGHKRDVINDEFVGRLEDLYKDAIGALKALSAKMREPWVHKKA
jgi:hypothetical protein